MIIGHTSGDDAAIYKMSDEVALVQTVDFFPPIVDDPNDYGEIAVANALSDVYAMGGKPLLGMNIVAFPAELSKDILGEIIEGGANKAREAGLLIVGGHTVTDAEPKYGLAVTGIIKPGSETTNSGSKSGDVLILTKPIGTGIITTAGKAGQIEPEIMDDCIKYMKQLNSTASEIMQDVGVNACVDITGFGLLGHLNNMVVASNVQVEIAAGKVPLMSNIIQLANAGMVPGGTYHNLEYVGKSVSWGENVDEIFKVILCDPQTSGGLLISVPEEKSSVLLDKLLYYGIDNSEIIGKVYNQGELGLTPIIVN